MEANRGPAHPTSQRWASSNCLRTWTLLWNSPWWTTQFTWAPLKWSQWPPKATKLHLCSSCSKTCKLRTCIRASLAAKAVQTRTECTRWRLKTQLGSPLALHRRSADRPHRLDRSGGSIQRRWQSFWRGQMRANSSVSPTSRSKGWASWTARPKPKLKRPTSWVKMDYPKLNDWPSLIRTRLVELLPSITETGAHSKSNGFKGWASTKQLKRRVWARCEESRLSKRLTGWASWGSMVPITSRLPRFSSRRSRIRRSR